MTADEIYEKLASAIVGSIKTANWNKAQLHLEVIGSSVDFKGHLNDNERFNAPGGFSLAKSVLNLSFNYYRGWQEQMEQSNFYFNSQR